MLNGADRNWMRLCAAIDGFRTLYGKWPTRIRLFPDIIEDLKQVLGSESFSILESKLQLIADNASIVAEDEEGQQFSYGDDKFPEKLPDIRARDWLGIESLPEFWD
ncbi:MAG: hypothetical protein DRG25_02205 [Deltaproteobacteria bacterium]|nr:MAG: hypothetical protein DRG25_02205 [Deltaproteobacteria bacterium]